ncbi:MAG TPA: chloride channel protein [Gemmatimonadales bacterium]|nr:chloride channel protein [Gemmatimonadales bacterium]
MTPDSDPTVPVAPSLDPALQSAGITLEPEPDHRRLLQLSALACLMGLAGATAAEVLVKLIALATNLFFYQRISLAEASPAGHGLGVLVIAVPIIGGLIVGLMARLGTPAIRGHGIPEAMERILHGESRISPRVTLLKPLSAAVSIGTGGPFGAEGPIIATGGALGSILGQTLHTTADERKVLLAAGAAAGMSAIFGAPVSAVLLAVELLLFEYRARSLVPVALAASVAAGVRMVLHGPEPTFPMPLIAQPSGSALVTYIAIGALIGLAAVVITRMLYRIEDAFERLPVHWMWWPAIGAVVVGIVGWLEPLTLGVGYDNITAVLSGDIVGTALLLLVVAKLVSWSVALGSGTSGGTLAPLFTIGGGLGALVGASLQRFIPALGVDPRVAALVGMAAIFAGASRALMTSVVFAFETTRQPVGLLPLLAGCTGAYLVSLVQMRSTIMTERLERRGTAVPADYGVDHLAGIRVRDACAEPAVSLAASMTISDARDWLVSGEVGTRHQGFPVLDSADRLVGVVMAREVRDTPRDPSETVGALVTRPAAVIFEDQSVRDAADHMVRQQVGRLPVVARSQPATVIGIITRSDLLEAHERRLQAAERRRRAASVRRVLARIRPR